MQDSLARTDPAPGAVRRTVLGVIFGALILASLLNGMTLLAVPPVLKFIVRGGVLTPSPSGWT